MADGEFITGRRYVSVYEQFSGHCRVDGCDEPMARQNCSYCERHWAERLAVRRAHREERHPVRRRILTKDGYVLLRVGSGYQLEHHIVMEKLLGRPLARGEQVRHRNAMRDDNRPENLELWVVRGLGTPAAGLVCPHCGLPYLPGPPPPNGRAPNSCIHCGCYSCRRRTSGS